MSEEAKTKSQEVAEWCKAWLEETCVEGAPFDIIADKAIEKITAMAIEIDNLTATIKQEQNERSGARGQAVKMTKSALEANRKLNVAKAVVKSRCDTCSKVASDCNESCPLYEVAGILS